MKALVIKLYSFTEKTFKILFSDGPIILKYFGEMLSSNYMYSSEMVKSKQNSWKISCVKNETKSTCCRCYPALCVMHTSNSGI
jgi:hypothetical protein